MFQYEYEKRPASASSCDSRAKMAATDWTRAYPSASRVQPNAERARRPLPPRPIVCDRMPTKTTVPLKVWIIASASCFAVCAALVLATVAITRWGAEERYTTRELFNDQPVPIYAKHLQPIEPTEPEQSSEEIDNNIAKIAILEKLSLFKNIVSNRDKNLLTKPQIHPLHDVTHHPERRIEKKDKAKLPDNLKFTDLTSVPRNEADRKIINEFNNKLPEFNNNQPEFNNNQPEFNNNQPEFNNKLPEFKPILPGIAKVTLPENYIKNFNNKDYEEYYNDENLYDDYMQSNTMTNYLLEKVQELHDWITSDQDFAANTTKVGTNTKTEFSQLLRALNDSLVEGNVTIVMNKLRDMYFGDNYTSGNNSRRVILTNSTDLLSFGILTLDIMLLHNIQMMAWESQEAARIKMLKDPDVFAFNALFLEPGKVEAKQAEVLHTAFSKRQSLRQEPEDFDLGKNLFENVLEVGMSAARAAIHLGRAYKNARNILSQLSNREPVNIQNQISRHIDDNTHALNHLQTSFSDINSSAVTVSGTYTELDCVWLLYCRNLVATAKLNPPFGTMSRINGMALRMLAGELSADRALDTMLYEVLTGWTDLKCNDMFPKCSKVNAASVVLNTILQPTKKQASNKGR